MKITLYHSNLQILSGFLLSLVYLICCHYHYWELTINRLHWIGVLHSGWPEYSFGYNQCQLLDLCHYEIFHFVTLIILANLNELLNQLCIYVTHRWKEDTCIKVIGNLQSHFSLEVIMDTFLTGECRHCSCLQTSIFVFLLSCNSDIHSFNPVKLLGNLLQFLPHARLWVKKKCKHLKRMKLSNSMKLVHNMHKFDSACTFCEFCHS